MSRKKNFNYLSLYNFESPSIRFQNNKNSNTTHFIHTNKEEKDIIALFLCTTHLASLTEKLENNTRAGMDFEGSRNLPFIIYDYFSKKNRDTRAKIRYIIFGRFM